MCIAMKPLGASSWRCWRWPKNRSPPRLTEGAALLAESPVAPQVQKHHANQTNPPRGLDRRGHHRGQRRAARPLLPAPALALDDEEAEWAELQAYLKAELGELY